MYIYEILKKEASWPIVSATIERNPPKKSLQRIRYLRYNSHEIYTYYDLKCAKENGLNVYLIDESPNTLIYEKNTRIRRKDMFGEWGNILYNIKKEKGTAGKVNKALLVLLWSTLSFARKRISEIVKPLKNQIKRIHINEFIIAWKVNLKTDIEISELKFEKRGIPSEEGRREGGGEDAKRAEIAEITVAKGHRCSRKRIIKGHRHHRRLGEGSTKVRESLRRKESEELKKRKIKKEIGKNKIVKITEIAEIMVTKDYRYHKRLGEESKEVKGSVKREEYNRREESEELKERKIEKEVGKKKKEL
ncbi:hypothetical protein Glove_145g32 [Diversispora epigaea]|uniref:Uncharacterized protein n=1 Tax=Diversispora epigaea TaxID=1348612 RepID=A0A397J2G9_9GLOM|nr:hypothetical protein Glove_145g32 [Diversispora epigaea]